MFSSRGWRMVDASTPACSTALQSTKKNEQEQRYWNTFCYIVFFIVFSHFCSIMWQTKPIICHEEPELRSFVKLALKGEGERLKQHSNLSIIFLWSDKKECYWIILYLSDNLEEISRLPFKKFLHDHIHFLPSFVTKLSFSFFSSRATSFLLGALHPWSSFHYFPLPFFSSSAFFSFRSPVPRRSTGITAGVPTHPLHVWVPPVQPSEAVCEHERLGSGGRWALWSHTPPQGLKGPLEGSRSQLLLTVRSLMTLLAV